jgi:GNAT superfamily N-acetyltransferase
VCDRRPASEVRHATPADLARIPEIDAAAEALFHDAGYELPRIPYDVDGLRHAVAVLVAGDPPVAYLQLDEVDGQAHVAEVSVLPAATRRGIGSRLLERACGWARERGYPAISLITYADVPWNAPWYARHGFVEVEPTTPELLHRRRRQSALGLDAVGRRIVMRRGLAAEAPPPPERTESPSRRR